MKIVEFRLPVPVGLPEYKKLCIFLVVEASLNEIENGTGLEVFRNETFEQDGKKGSYTEKRYHLAKSMPNWMQSIISPKYTILTERSWNMYPLSITKYQNEALSSVEFSVQTEVVASLQIQDNIFGLEGKDLKKRSIVLIDIAKFNKSKSYNASYDLTLKEDKSIGFLPLKPDWFLNYTGEAIMCYKLIRINIPYFGLLASKIETYIANMLQDKLMFYTCSALCTMEKWYDVPLRMLKKSEVECYDQLNQRFKEMEISSAGAPSADTGEITIPSELYRDYPVPYVFDDDEEGNELKTKERDDGQDEKDEETILEPEKETLPIADPDESSVYKNAQVIHSKLQDLQPTLRLDSPYSNMDKLCKPIIDPMENMSSVDSVNSVIINNANIAEMCAEDALCESFVNDLTPTALELYGPVAIPNVQEAVEPSEQNVDESDSEFKDALETFDDLSDERTEPSVDVAPATLEKSHAASTEDVCYPEHVCSSEDSDSVPEDEKPVGSNDGDLSSDANDPPQEEDIAKIETDGDSNVASEPQESDSDPDNAMVVRTQPARHIEPSPDTPATFTGYLFKLGRGFSSWNWSLRYIIVCGINMYYFDNKDDIKPKNTICIRDSRIAFVGPYINRSFVFSITTKNRSVYYFSADAQDSVKRWILLLQVLCEETPSSIVRQLASEWAYEANEDI
ncbi:phosphatidylinositol transfer protein, putative [Theileria equi strain WA]|uniref:Phosphatidylinositol transfer protein, putative n=1 Tax=Theileria equi strain WA TaxID=1537102 RepID=L0AXD7_THEEQ|nr:phosphatidylinositol transfer protein, putative [Theileria equi strain WA]AFZ79691.1 phosphatidylinositol transfer protein, putative [Theileria equi strain WA]|eukprot:XP_004829357.1 phosphatidylinositol transfer protein, putative [Theileria equi strain WA]